MTEIKGDLISREWLEDAFDNLCCHNCKICRNFRIEDSFYKCALIDNAPTVDAIVNTIEVRPQGELLRKEDVIHSIAKQYSEHNELVPIWLSIADMKGGAE